MIRTQERKRYFIQQIKLKNRQLSDREVGVEDIKPVFMGKKQILYKNISKLRAIRHSRTVLILTQKQNRTS